MSQALAGQPAVAFPRPDYSLIPAGQQLGTVGPSTTLVPRTTLPSTTLPPDTIVEPSIPEITRPPRPTYTTPTRPPRQTGTTRYCYVDPRTDEQVCR